MLLGVTSIYAGLSGLLLLVLSLNVSRHRGRAKVSIGDGNDKALSHAIRAQGNFVEYAPLTLLLIAIAEAQGAPALAIHLLGAGLVVGRVLHAYGITRRPSVNMARMVGMILTYVTLLVAALGVLVHAVIG